MKADPFLSDPVLTGPPMVNLEEGGPDGGWSFLGRSRETDSFLAHLEKVVLSSGCSRKGSSKTRLVISSWSSERLILSRLV